MNKIFTLCIALMAMSCLPIAAQEGNDTLDKTFQFQNAQGQVIDNGSTIICNQVKEDEFGDIQLPTGLFIKNTESDIFAGKVLVDLSHLPNGKFQCCAFGSCKSESSPNQYFASSSNVLESGNVQDIQTEWIPDEKGYTSWSATLQIVNIEASKGKSGGYTYGDIIGYGPKITVNFVYADPTGINEIDGESNVQVVARYDANGAKLSFPRHGLNIVKLSNGKLLKQIVR